MKVLTVVLVFLFELSGWAQVNLVPNPSFEQIDTCPYNQDQLHFAAPWFKPTPNTPDLFHECATSLPLSVPGNLTGWQVPRTGSGYAGLGGYAFFPPNSNEDNREYISIALTDTLNAGQRYCVEFYASLSNASYWGINRLGLHVSKSPLPNDNQIDTLSAIPQIYADSNMILLDTMNWIKISGVYYASGGERYVTIGNFYADNQTDTIGNLGSTIAAYYYIDDVAVYELAECRAGSDISICYKDSVQLGTASSPNVLYEWTPSGGLSDPNISNPIATPDTSTLYILKQTECDAVTYDSVLVTVNRDCHSATSILIPTMVIATQEYFISGLESNSQLDIYDVRGRVVFACDDYQNDFRFMNEEQAVYVVVLTRPNGEQILQKVCVVKE